MPVVFGVDRVPATTLAAAWPVHPSLAPELAVTDLAAQLR